MVPARLAAAQNRTPGGFSPTKLAAIPPLLQSYVDDGTIAGAVTLLYRKGETPQVATVGYRNIEAGLPMTRDTIFRVASSTKPILCSAVLSLVDQGRIGLHDPVDRWLPELSTLRVLDDPDGPLDKTHAAPRAITLLDLLTHRGGFINDAPPGPLGVAFAGLRKDDPTHDVWMQRLAEIPLIADPGTRFTYGVSHNVLGVLLARLTGQSLNGAIQQTICAPLGMTETNFWPRLEKHHRVAGMYVRDAATGRQVPSPVLPVGAAPRTFQSGGGGLYSTADDYLKVARMLLDKGKLGNARILSRSTVAMMTTNWLTPLQRSQGAFGIPDFWASQGFGLGVSVTSDVSQINMATSPYSSVGSFGWPGSSGVYWRADPVEDMILIYLIQNASGGAAAQAAAPKPKRMPPLAAFATAAYRAIDT